MIATPNMQNAAGHMNARTTLSNSDLSLVGGRANIIDTKWEIRDRASLSCKSSWGFSGVGRARWVENAEGGSQVPCNLVVSIQQA